LSSEGTSLREDVMHDTLMLWHADHVNFGRLLNLLEDELGQVHDAAAPDYELMHDILFYMTHYSDLLHHPKEELMFARVKSRDASRRPTIDSLTLQHARLKEIGEGMVGVLDAVVNGSITPRERVEAATRTYIAELREHMRTEESEILPSAGRLLTDADWAEIDAAIAHVDDPLFGGHVHERYAGLRDAINRQAQASRAAAPS